MANLERVFDIEKITSAENAENVKQAVEALEGVNHVGVDPKQNKVIVDYTPGLINVQMIKEVIEGHGLDVK